MEDIVAVAVTSDTGEVSYFITWGRIQHRIESRPLESLILKVASHFALPGRPVSAKLCSSLQVAREAPLFYEALLSFAHKPIPFGPGYEQWRSDTGAKMQEAKEIYFAGPWRSTAIDEPERSP